MLVIAVDVVGEAAVEAVIKGTLTAKQIPWIEVWLG
jgi:hypothetical protein